MAIQVQIERVPNRRYRVSHDQKEIGIWRDPECATARWLLAHNLARRSDVLHVFRGSALALGGGIGWLADHQIREDAATSRFAKWKPFHLSPL